MGVEREKVVFFEGVLARRGCSVKPVKWRHCAIQKSQRRLVFALLRTATQSTIGFYAAMGRKERTMSTTYCYFRCYQAVENKLHKLEDLASMGINLWRAEPGRSGLPGGFI